MIKNMVNLVQNQRWVGNFKGWVEGGLVFAEGGLKVG